MLNPKNKRTVRPGDLENLNLLIRVLRAEVHSSSTTREEESAASRSPWVILGNIPIYMLNQPQEVVSWRRMSIQSFINYVVCIVRGSWEEMLTHQNECEIILNHLFVWYGSRRCVVVSLKDVIWQLLCWWSVWTVGKLKVLCIYNLTTLHSRLIVWNFKHCRSGGLIENSKKFSDPKEE